ncbi:MAG: glycosyltransferase family 4 protein [Planctomycetota bacterium]
MPIVVTLQGDDVFLDFLREPYRTQCLERIAEVGKHVDAFIVHSEFYRDYISDYLSLDPSKFFVTPLGLELDDFELFRELDKSEKEESESCTIGYLARLAPEKGLQHLIDAFIKLKEDPRNANLKLRVAGWLSPQNKQFANEQFEKLHCAGLSGHVDHVGTIEREQKLEFLRSIDIFSVPTDFLEPKGIYALEAMAAGLPVVAPDHGAFPEMAKSTGGMKLFSARDTSALAGALDVLIHDTQLRHELGQRGQASVFQHRNSDVMARITGDVIVKVLEQR